LLYLLHHFQFKHVLCFTNSLESTHRLGKVTVTGLLKVTVFPLISLGCCGICFVRIVVSQPALSVNCLMRRFVVVYIS
jgi:hypothetical protein